MNSIMHENIIKIRQMLLIRKEENFYTECRCLYEKKHYFTAILHSRKMVFILSIQIKHYFIAILHIRKMVGTTIGGPHQGLGRALVANRFW